MSRSLLPQLSRSRFTALAVLALVIVIGLHSIFAPAYGAELGNRELSLTDNTPSDVSTYQLSFTLATAGALGSISIQFCANDPLIGNPCVAPTGFSDSSTVLSSQTGQTNFSISAASTANQIILTRPPAGSAIEPVSYTFTGMTNPSIIGPYYVRLQTYPTNDATGLSSDYGGIAFDMVSSLSVTAEVPPYLIFCTGQSIPQPTCDSAVGDYVNFGDLTSQTTAAGTSQMLTASNAANGYNVTLSGTTLESGNNVITPLSADDVSRPGTSQFGLNLRANSSPSIGSDPTGLGTGTPTANYDEPNFYRFDPEDIVVSNPGPENARIYTVSYIVNIPSTQPPGYYVSTLTYICLATF
jgi:hypothetical protein